MADFHMNLDMLVDQNRFEPAKSAKPAPVSQPADAFSKTLRAQFSTPQQQQSAPSEAAKPLPPLRLNQRLENFVSAPPVYRPSAAQSLPAVRYPQPIQSSSTPDSVLTHAHQSEPATPIHYDAQPQNWPGQVSYHSAPALQPVKQQPAANPQTQPAQTTQQSEVPAAEPANQQTEKPADRVQMLAAFFPSFALPALAKPVTQAPFSLISTEVSAPQADLNTEASDVSSSEVTLNVPKLNPVLSQPILVVVNPAPVQQPVQVQNTVQNLAAPQATPDENVATISTFPTEDFFPIFFPLFAALPAEENKTPALEFAPVFNPFEAENSAPQAPVLSYSFVQFQAFETSNPEPQLMLVPVAMESRPLEDWVMALYEANQFTAGLKNQTAERPSSFFGAPSTEDAVSEENFISDLTLSEFDDAVESDETPGLSLRDIVQLPPEVIQRLDLSLLLMMQSDDESVWPEDASFWQNMLKAAPLSVRPRFSAGQTGSNAVPVEEPKALQLSIWALLPKTTPAQAEQSSLEVDLTISPEAVSLVAPVTAQSANTSDSESQSNSAQSEPHQPTQTSAPAESEQQNPAISIPVLHPTFSSLPAESVESPAKPAAIELARLAPISAPTQANVPTQAVTQPASPVAQVQQTIPVAPPALKTIEPVSVAPFTPAFQAKPQVVNTSAVVNQSNVPTQSESVVATPAPTVPSAPVQAEPAAVASATPVTSIPAPVTQTQQNAPVVSPSPAQSVLHSLELPQGIIEVHPLEPSRIQHSAPPAAKASPAPSLNHLELKVGQLHVRPVDAPRNEQPTYGQLSLSGQWVQSDLVQAPAGQSSFDQQPDQDQQSDANPQPVFTPLAPRQDLPAAVPFKLDVVPPAPRAQSAALPAETPLQAPPLRPASSQEAQPDFQNYLSYDANQALKQVKKFVSRLETAPAEVAEAPSAKPVNRAADHAAAPAAVATVPVANLTASQVIQAINNGVPLQVSDFPAFVNAVIQKLDPGSRIIQSFEVTLTPDNLGQVTAQFGLTNQNRVVITLYTQSAVTAQTLETYQQEIKQIVDKTQLSLGQLTVKQAVPAARQGQSSQGGNFGSANNQSGAGAADYSSRQFRRNKKRRGGDENLSIDVTV